MADKRAFAKFDVGYLDNPKMADVLDSSLYAICMHFASVLHCSQHLTDGLVAPKAMQRKVGASDADTRILIDAGLWHDSKHDCEACWEACPEIPENRVYVHDFLEHNRDAAEAKRVSKKRSDAAKKRWSQPESGGANVMQSALQDAQQNEPACNAERERKKERENTSSSTAAPSKDFDQFWAVYPKKVSKQAAIRAWKKAIRHAEPEAIIQGAKRYAETERKKGTERDFLKGPDGWLNAGRWEDEAWETANGEIDVDAILGRDLWQLPAPPEDLPAHEYKAWAVRVRREHDEARYAEAQKRATA